MRKLLLPLAMTAALGLFGTTAMAGEPIDDSFDDVPGDATDDVAVPEPTGALAMGAGLAAIAFALRRRR